MIDAAAKDLCRNVADAWMDEIVPFYSSRPAKSEINEKLRRLYLHTHHSIIINRFVAPS